MPAAIAARRTYAGWVLLTAINLIASRGLPLRLAAASIRDHTPRRRRRKSSVVESSKLISFMPYRTITTAFSDRQTRHCFRLTFDISAARHDIVRLKSMKSPQLVQTGRNLSRHGG